METPLRYPALAPSQENPADVIPQDLSLHAVQQVMNGVDGRVIQPRVQDVGLGGSLTGQSWVFGPPPSGERWSQLFCHSV